MNVVMVYIPLPGLFVIHESNHQDQFEHEDSIRDLDPLRANTFITCLKLVSGSGHRYIKTCQID